MNGQELARAIAVEDAWQDELEPIEPNEQPRRRYVQRWRKNALAGLTIYRTPIQRALPSPEYRHPRVAFDVAEEIRRMTTRGQILSWIQEHGPTSNARIAKQLRRARGTICGSVRRLTAAGLVTAAGGRGDLVTLAHPLEGLPEPAWWDKTAAAGFWERRTLSERRRRESAAAARIARRQRGRLREKAAEAVEQLVREYPDAKQWIREHADDIGAEIWLDEWGGVLSQSMPLSPTGEVEHGDPEVSGTFRVARQLAAQRFALEDYVIERIDRARVDAAKRVE